METIVFILVFAVLWAWIEIIRSKQVFREQIAALTNRIWFLEKQLQRPQSAPIPEPAHELVQQPAAHPAPTPIVHTPPPIPAFAASIAASGTTPPPRPVPPRTYTPPPAPPMPEPSLLERLGGQDWESLVGGNLLNKLGALVLVIGIMLFLAYYGTRMGPAGRAGCSLLVSLTLLASGVWLERRETYRTFARGLIGAGWAALYATAYAIYALPEARIIENPFLGSFVVLLVAVGMIAHSLRYHSQGVTAVAFFSAFAALAVTPSAPFAVISLIPLAAAVLYLGQRFNWYHMALMGVFATYGACAWHGSSDAPLIEVEALFIFYWALFEVFDLMRFARRVGGWAVALIFPLNAAGFLALSYVSWSSKSPETIWRLSACAAAMYLVSTLWRLKIELVEQASRCPSDLPSRIRAGTYEAPLVLGAFLTATAIVQELTGMWMSTALALEAEALFTAGIRFRSRFLRVLASIGFVASLAYLADTASNHPWLVNVLGHMTHAWVLIVLFHAGLFYVNRAMSETKSVIGIGYGWAASLLVVLALGKELPLHYIGTGWMLLAAILFEFGNARKLFEFRAQAYFIAVFGAWQSLVYIIKPPDHEWIPLAFGAAFAYAAAWRVDLLSRDRQADSPNREWNLVGWAACAFTALFATVVLIRQLRDEYVGVALWGLALLLLELGLQRLPARLRVFAYPVALIASVACFGSAQTSWVKFAPPQGWLCCLGAAAAAGIMSARLSTTSPDNASPAERTIARGFLSGIGLLFALIALWIVVPDEFVPAAWAALGLAALEAGNALGIQTYRLQAQGVAAIAALSAFGFTLPEGHLHRVLAIALLIAVHIGFRVRSVAPDALEGAFEGKLPMLHEAVSAILAAALIFQEVSGRVLTVAWGAEALVLLGIGFVFRERPLRLDGLALFLICVLKLFLYDLRNLETPYRILSFIALGPILLGVSWIYTRFREQ